MTEPTVQHAAPDAASSAVAWGGSPIDWAIAGGIAATIILAVMLLKPILIRRFSALAGRTSTGFDDAAVEALKATKLWLVAAIAVALGAQHLALSHRIASLLAGAATLAGFFQGGLWLNTLLMFWLKRSRAHAKASDSGAATSLAAMGFLAQMVVWTVIVLLALDNLGFNITTLIAGLGVGGVAVALAVQNILGDLFASLSIVIDKPFVIGDFIIVDDYMGTVEYVGLKSTRLRSLNGEQIVMGNADLLKTRIRNYKRMYERRIAMSFHVPYDTPTERLEKIPPLLQKLITAHAKVRFERAHLAKLGESALEYEVIWWVTDPDYNTYMDIQQALNLAMLREFRALRVDFAFPTRTVVVDPEPEREEARDFSAPAREPAPRGRPS